MLPRLSDDLLGKNGILEQLTKRVVERALQGEMVIFPFLGAITSRA